MTRKASIRLAACLLLFGALAPLAVGQVQVLTQHNDSHRTGANTQETILNVNNVSTPDFGKLWEYPVRGRIYAQPLYVNLRPSAVSGRLGQIVIVATAENWLTAFNVNSSNPKALWSYDAGSAAPALAARVYLDDDGNFREQNISPVIGIIGTPVIDLPHFTIYFVAMRQPDPNKDDFVHQLHAVDIRNGAPRHAPVDITGTIEGGGVFDSRRQLQRAALALFNNRIYVAWAGFADIGPYDGLVMSYDSMDSATPLQKRGQFQVARFNPILGRRHKGGGIWHSGGGPAVDDRFLYIVTGNGSSSNTHAGTDFDSSAVKLDASLHVVDYYTPSYQNFLNENDMDLSVAGPMIPEDQDDRSGRPRKLLLHGSKAGLLYVLDRDGMGGFDEHDNHIIQSIRVFPDADDLSKQMDPSHIHTTPVYWHASSGPRVFVASDYNLGVRAFRFDHEKLDPHPVAANFFPRAPITQMSLSSDGGKAGTGILWAISSPTGTVATYPGILYAFDAETLEMLYSSEANPFDHLGDYPRFNAPTIAEGMVFVPTFSNKLVVYGLCSKITGKACAGSAR